MAALENAQHELFCNEYLKDFSASAAAERAGYSYDHGRRLTQKDTIKARIAELRDAQSLRTQITADRIALEYARLAFSDIRDVAEVKVHEPDDGSAPETFVRVRTFDELPRDVTATVREISERVDAKGRTISVKQHDKYRALEVLAERYWTPDEANDSLIEGIASLRQAGVPDLSEPTHNTASDADDDWPPEADTTGAEPEPKWRKGS